MLLAAAWHSGWFSNTPALPRLSLVVLPFENVSGDASENYLTDAITDDVATDLSRVPGMFVIARDSAYTYQGQAIDVRKIGESLRVCYVRQPNAGALPSTRPARLASGIICWAYRVADIVGWLDARAEPACAV